MEDKSLAIYQSVQQQLDGICDSLGLDEGVKAYIRQPQREITVSIPVKMDDGTVKVFTGFRVQHNNARGPYKGGIRFYPTETINTVRSLATWMSLKCAVMDLPLGGGKGGIICDPKNMSMGELERLSRGYIRKIWKYIGPDQDIPAPDVYTNGQIMTWMMDEFNTIKGGDNPSVITGKPIGLGGSLGRGDATSRGGMYVVVEAAKKLGIELKGAKVVVQGFGNAGSYIAELMHDDQGSSIIAVSDSKGGIYDPAGLDPKAVAEFKKMTGSVVGYPGAKPITNEELLELECDILFPAALEGVITADNVVNVKTKLIGELANGPLSFEANESLYKRGIMVLPDVLCNAGGVTVSYFEYVQGLYHHWWSLEEVHEKLHAAMVKAFNGVYETSVAKKVSMRQAAYMVAVKRIADNMKLLGWV